MPVMTIEYAHVIMQSHLDCQASMCPVKAQAKKRLVEAGRLVPADVPHQGF
ncbi:hypothetical protein ACQP2U_20500 [Nocardia sp. CA-084685]|uniref:hypothetical protein n=1 Tax=Nocardia sp. CA-084685 TaxID=3239970 RepID=UPI003D99147C